MSSIKSWWSRLRAKAAHTVAGTTDHVVFVSYAHEDEARVRQLVDDLKRRGLSTWFAPRQIPLGHSLPASVTRAIDASRIVLVAGSKQAASSEWVASEVAYALEREGRLQTPRVVPAYLVSADLPLDLRDRLAIDLRPSRYEAGLERLVGELIHGRMPQGKVPLAGFREFVEKLPVVSAEVLERLDGCVLRAWGRSAWVTPESTLDSLRRGGIPIDPAYLEQRARTLDRLESERCADASDLEQLLLSSDLAPEVRRRLVNRACAGDVYEAVTAEQLAEIRVWLRQAPSRDCLAAAAYLYGFSLSGYANGPFSSARIEAVREGWRARGEVDSSALPLLETFIDELLRLGVTARAEGVGRDEILDANATTLRFGRVHRSVGKSAYLYEAAALQDTALIPIGRLAHIERD